MPLIHIQESAPSTVAVSKIALHLDSTTKRWTASDEKLMRVPITGGLDSIKSIINGGFRFAQRQTPGTLTSYATSANKQYLADRWFAMVQTSSLQYARVDTNGTPEAGLDARYYGQFKQITGAGKFVIGQAIEAAQCLHERGNQVRVQCLLKASSAKTIRMGLIQLAAAGTADTIAAAFVSAYGADTVDPTFAANFAKITADILPLGVYGAAPGTMAVRSTAIDCSVTTAWQGFGGIFTVPTDCKNLVVVLWTDSQFAINDILNVSQVTKLNQLADCDWNEWPVAAELAMCQRFYVKTFEVDTLPAAATLAGALRAIVGKAAGALGAQFHWRFPVPMRGTPTIVTFNPVTAANSNPRRTGGTAADETAVATANVSSVSADITATDAASGAVGDAVQVQATADAEL